VNYSVKEIHYTLQGEGIHAGRPAVFLRFAGCNLWSGREDDRRKGPGGCAAWCDTDFVGTDGPGGGRFQTPSSLAVAVRETWPPCQRSRPFVICTGGEPLLQLDEALTAELHAAGFEVAVETNGTKLPPRGVDWICVSPKAESELVLRAGHELKLIFPQEGADPTRFESLDFTHFLLQPRDDADKEESTTAALQYCLAHPQWRLSLQLHKLLGIR